MPTPRTKDGTAIVGLGFTELTRTPDRSEIALGVEACRLAAQDAGLDPADVDGICIQVHHYPPPETDAIARGLGMKQVNWKHEGGPPGIGSVGMISDVLESGQCRTAVVCKIMNTIAPVTTPEMDPNTGEVSGDLLQFEIPYGLSYTMQRTGLYARRYMHQYGVTPEQIGWIAIVERDHAIEHPYAYQKRPITMEDYLSSRWIAEPVRLLDCDVPVNGAFAYVMTRGDAAKSLRHPPVYVKGWASEQLMGGFESFQTHHLFHFPDEAMTEQSKTLYRETKLSPKEIDIAFPYDGFSFFVPMWLESLGLVPRGEGGNFVDGGDRIRRTGEFPINTHGGNLSAGRMHAHHHVMEAVDQMRGTAGPRQITKPLNNAVLSAAFPYAGNTGILSRDP